MKGASIRQKNPHALAGLLDKCKELAKRQIACGYPAGKAQAYPDGTPVASVAAAHVYGNGVPVRNFMAYAKPGILHVTRPILAEAAKQVVQGDASAVDALQNAAGLAAVGEIKNAIVQGDYEPNSPVTIALKGSSKPLIDTSHMLQSTTYVVREKR